MTAKEIFSKQGQATEKQVPSQSSQNQPISLKGLPSKNKLSNAAEDKLQDAKADLRSKVSEASPLSKLKKPSAIASPAVSSGKVTNGFLSKFKGLFGKIQVPKAVWALIAGVAVIVSGLGGYFIGLNDPRLLRDSEDLSLEPVSFESFSEARPGSTAPNGIAKDFELFEWPLQDAGRITSCFGKRELLGTASFHTGLDIAVMEGTPVVASKTGVVEKYRVSSDSIGYGTFVLLRHSDGLRTLYAHLIPQLNLQDGQTIKQGEVFASSGNTGRSTGPHLHFEVISLEAKATNPAQFLSLRLDNPIYSSSDESCWYRDVSILQQ